MAVRSKLLALSEDVPTAQTLIYTVPSGETALVKWAQLMNTAGAVWRIRLFLDVGSGPKEVLAHSVPGTDSLEIPLWWALPPDAEIYAQSNHSGSINIALFGAELEGVAD